MRIVGEQFVLLLKQIEKSVSRHRIVLGDEIPNLHQVLLGKWFNSNGRHLPCPARVSLLAISLKALPATLLDRGDVEILARSALNALIPKPPNFTDRIGSRSASRLPLAQSFSDNLAACCVIAGFNSIANQSGHIGRQCDADLFYISHIRLQLGSQ